MMDQAPNKHTTDKAANRLQLPLQQLIELAADVRRRMLEGASLSSALETVSIGLSAQARAALQSIVYDAIRRRAFSNAAAAGLLSSPPPPPVMGLLEIAIALVVEGRYSDFTLVNETVNAARNNRRTVRFAGLINAVLRRFLREREQISAVLQKDLDVRFNAPLWWIRRIKESHPSNWEEILRIGTLHAPMTLRVNARRITPAAYLEELKARGIPALRVGRSAVMLESPLPVKDIPGFTEGIVSVQDAGTQLAAETLAPQKNEQILDACAAPGGKTAHLLESADCHVTALEIDPKRAELIKSTLLRLGVEATVRAADAAMVSEWHSGREFDAILLDAPCTASGIVRRQPDVPWSRRPEDPARLAREQARLLNALWPLVKKGGRLLYCTCSIFPEEGPDQIRRFTANHGDAQLTAFKGAPTGMMSLVPADHVHELPFNPNAAEPLVHDGFFYALLTKL